MSENGVELCGSNLARLGVERRLRSLTAGQRFSVCVCVCRGLVYMGQRNCLDNAIVDLLPIIDWKTRLTIRLGTAIEGWCVLGVW